MQALQVHVDLTVPWALKVSKVVVVTLEPLASLDHEDESVVQGQQDRLENRDQLDQLENLEMKVCKF